MTNSAREDSAKGDLDLGAVWSVLTDVEQLEYWKFAGKHVRELRHKTPTFKSLCAAVKDADRGKSAGRLSITVPSSARALSTEELQRSIGRLKGLLLNQPGAEPFLSGAFCMWIQCARRETLNAVLDAVKCPHSENGDLKGTIPDFDPKVAEYEICKLVSDHSAHDLALACGGLILNGPNWNRLTSTFESLQRTVQISEFESPVITVVEGLDDIETISATAEKCISLFDSTHVLQIREELSNLKVHLITATAEISKDMVPDLGSAFECWREVQKQHAFAKEMLKVSSSCVADLEDALAARSVATQMLIELARCRSIVHLTDPNFLGCATIAAKCKDIESDIDAQALTPMARGPVVALLRLIDDGEGLDDDTAAQLQIEIEGLFGRVVAAAAVRGKLSFVSPPSDHSEISGESAYASSVKVPLSTPDLLPEKTPLVPAVGPVAEAEPLQLTQLSTVDTSSTVQLVSLGSEEAEPTISRSIPDSAEIEAPPTQVETLVTAPTVTSPKRSTSCEIELCAVDSGPSTPSQIAAADPDFESFENFSRSHWVDSAGAVASAPWSTDGFATQMTKHALEAWELGDIAIAYIFSRAVYAAGKADPLGIDDLASADSLLSEPSSHSAGVDTGRADRLRMLLSTSNSSHQNNIGLALMLEALRPTHPCSFTPIEVEGLLNFASYNDPALTEVVQFLLLGWSAQLNPLAPLRARLLDSPEEPLNVVEAALRSAQVALRTEVATLWSAAGGKLQRTHCRGAWAKFVVEVVAPLRDDLVPEDPKGSSRIIWTPERIRERVTLFGRSFQRIMDSAQVKHQDRSAAEGAARQIVEAISRVSDALQRFDAQRMRSRASYDGIPYDAALRLLAESSSSTTDRLCSAVFSAVIQGQPQTNELRLKAGYLINHVDLIRHLGAAILQRPGIASSGVSALDFDEPAPVSVLLLEWRGMEPPVVAEDGELLVALRNCAADRERRDILAALSSTEVLQGHERTLLHRYALELGDEAFEATRKLERLWGSSNELMTSQEAKLKSVVDEAISLTSMGSSGGSISKSLLLRAWLNQSIDRATAHRNDAAQALLELARGKPGEICLRIENYFSAGDYRSGVALFHGGVVPKAASDRSALRRTMWRAGALSVWPEPRTKLAKDLRGSTPEQNRLVDAWTSSSAEPSQRDTMYKLLYSVISGEAGRSLSENQKRFPVKLADLREHKDRRTTISCATIRAYFQGSKLNPTFLPQLADFSQIVLTSSPHQAKSSLSVLDDWCKAASTEGVGSLVVFLAPGLPLIRRDELCSGLRRRGVSAAIIDDVDLCRLCAASTLPDGHDFVPFFEILLEQLDLDRASPFSSLDGQHVRLETYIGRTQEAHRVALGWSYTRMFSGRKLGKSALLKYVANTFDGYQLPSGNNLSVFFITIAGGESERWVVDCIVDEMATRFGLSEGPALKDQVPAERFSAYMKRFLQEKPGHSVLLILDEADAFVEGQLVRYDADREGSLSFRMMKELPAQVDANQLPRIRTIFSGYRVTNTRGGVWANAGDVLVLRPLAEEEAVQFLQGMLARIGIDLRDHAPFIAMRCGFQPAVLIRFGESLIKRLKRSSKSANRETLAVTHDEVLATLSEQGVLDEIKTVVNNNFQGNRMGAVMFGATLLALKDLEPGLALTQGPGQVLEKLREIDSNLDWLERIDTSPLAEIERNLQDFIDRELLTVSDAPRFGVREYRLRFPHFLPVLTQQSEVALEVRQQIQAIRASASQRRLSECVLSESSLDTVRYWYHQESITDCKLVVVGGHWTGALLDPKCGVPDRLGCERAAFSGSTEPGRVSDLIATGKHVFGNVAEPAWSEFLAAHVGRPLVLIGCVDLQRVARRYALDGGEVPVEVVTLGRLTEATLAWWFEDARALHFKTSDAIAKIAHSTGLVPYLAESFNRLLMQIPGSDVTDAELRTALSRIEEDLPNSARILSDPSWEGGLTAREIELLKMSVLVAEEASVEFELEREFPEYWALLDLPSIGDGPLSKPGDWSALKLLAETGLLPVKVGVGATLNTQSLGRVIFDTNGILVRLIKALGPIGAG